MTLSRGSSFVRCSAALTQSCWDHTTCRKHSVVSQASTIVNWSPNKDWLCGMTEHGGEGSLLHWQPSLWSFSSWGTFQQSSNLEEWLWSVYLQNLQFQYFFPEMTSGGSKNSLTSQVFSFAEIAGSSGSGSGVVLPSHIQWLKKLSQCLHMLQRSDYYEITA